jgi:hypothetical protein
MSKQKWILLESLFPTTDDLTGSMVITSKEPGKQYTLTEIDLSNSICYVIEPKTKIEKIIPLSEAMVIE